MRLYAILLAALLAACAAATARVETTVQTWILPLSAKDAEQVCVITMDYPGRRCTTAGDLRSFVRSIRAD